MADGWITIGTSLSTDKFDKEIANLQKKMKKQEDKKLVIQTKLQGQDEQLELAIKKTDELADAFQRLNAVQEKVASGKATPTDYTTMLNLINQYGNLGKIEDNFNKALTSQEAIEAKAIQLRSQYEQINKEVGEYKNKIEGLQLQKQQVEVQKMKDGFKGVGSSIQDAVNKASKLVLGIFGIRSAYMMLRRASSDLASYDQQYATNLEYIRFVLTQAIAPVLRWIVSLAAKLLQIIGMIVSALFGVNIFSSGSAENFRKMKAGASGVGKAVKEIKKQLMGFDEVNVLTDQSDTGTSAGAGGVGMPDFDISDWEGEVPQWLQWIVDNKDLILAVLGGIAAGLLAINLGATGIQALGIGVMVMGIIYTIESLLDYLNDPSWENFGKVIQGVGIAIIGLGILINSVPLIVIGAAVLILGTIIKYWDNIKAFLQKGINWLLEKSDWVHEMFGDTIGNIYDTFVGILQKVLNWFDVVFTSIKGVFDGIIMFVKGVFTGDWQMAWEGVKNIFINIWEIIKSTFFTFIGVISSVAVSVAQTVGDIIGGIFKAIVNAVLWTIEKVLNSPIRAINGLIGVINAVPGIELRRLNEFNLPRLKTGGIINMPNKGTLVGSAIGGESGREGVVPLTDQQAMAELGREIGKNVLINLTNVTSMNGRVISRELKQIQADQNFAYNT